MKNRDIFQLYTTNQENPNDPEGIRHYFQRIIENMPNNVYWLNRDCITMGCNRNTLKLLGLNHLSEFVGITYEQMGKLANWDEGQAQSFKRDDMEVMESGSPKINIEEPPLYDKEGNPVYYLSSRVPLFDNNNVVIGVVGISINITEHKKLEKELKHSKQKAEAANQAKSEFIANMSHDLRTPMSGILGALENSHNILKTLLPQLIDHSEITNTPSFRNELIEQLKIVSTFSGGGYESSRALMDLFNNILETLQLESGRKLQESPEAFDLKALIQSVMQLVKSMALKKKIHCSLELEESVPHYLTGLPHPLSRTLLNLVNNALKFTKQGSVTVHINVVEDKKPSAPPVPGDFITLQIRVTDTGIGIPKDKFETIFEPFTLLTPSYRGLYQGSGLGLYAVKCYVEQMQGTIDVESELGKGSCFTVNLPLKVADASDLTQNPEEPEPSASSDSPAKEAQEQAPAPSSHQATIESHQAHPDSPKKKATVLLVEDHPLIAHTHQYYLRQTGCTTDIAATGQSALDQAAQKHYDLIFMDVGLPDKSGIEVTQELRESGWKGPIIGLTGHAKNPEYRKACFKAGMNEVIGKPVDEEILTPLLQHWVWDQEQQEHEKEQEKEIDLKDDNESLPLIDWQACLERYHKDEPFVRNLLSNYIQDLKHSQQLIATAYKEQKFKALREELHHQEGALCHVALPRLEQSLILFHKAVKQVPDNKVVLELLYQRVQNAFDATLKTLKSSTD